MKETKTTRNRIWTYSGIYVGHFLKSVESLGYAGYRYVLKFSTLLQVDTPFNCIRARHSDRFFFPTNFQ